MRKLIIIGNGFDLAHGLKTNYNAFIEDLINKYFMNKSVFKDIIEKSPTHITSFKLLLEYMNKPFQKTSRHGRTLVINENPLKFKNEFIESLISSTIEDKWCDIEYEYFKQLMIYYNSNIKMDRLKKLNYDFDIIKKHLIDYLINEEKKANRMDAYEKFFKLLANSNDTLILNFNYTKTLEKLYADSIKCPIVHIHGELENEEKIIFGYAANKEDTKRLSSFDNDEYLKNIKSFSYKRTNNKNTLKEFLKPYQRPKSPDGISTNNIDSDTIKNTGIFLFGHSCGLSDQLILNEIFNNDVVSSIRIFYHDNCNNDNYTSIQNNIYRITNDDTKFEDLIETYPNSCHMPQWNDNEEQIKKFMKYIENLNVG